LSHTTKDEGLALVNRVLLLEALGFKDLIIPRPKIYIGETEKNLALAQLRQAELSPEDKIFMIAAFGSSPDKTYPLPYMAKVLDELVARTQASLLFNYLPEQRPQLDELISLCKPSTQSHLRPDIYGKSLREFLALASCCNAIIGNEGGAVNMGKAFELPTFSIFSPWILKSAWNSYEASGDNRSVHLADLHPDLYRQNPKKYKKQAASYYIKLDPEFVIKNMMTFLDHHDFSASKP
jgi:heptosyltransferase-2